MITCAGMAVSSACSATTVDIVCGTLQAKLITADLSPGSSRCIQFGSSLLSPCEFQRQAGKASSKNWKNSIRYMGQAISNALENTVTSSGKRCCRFVGFSILKGSNHDNPLLSLANSQPPGQPPGQPPILLDSYHHSQPLDLTGHLNQ